MPEFRKYIAAIVIGVSFGALAACAPTDERRGTGEVVDDAGLTARMKTALIKAGEGERYRNQREYLPG